MNIHYFKLVFRVENILDKEYKFKVCEKFEINLNIWLHAKYTYSKFVSL